VLAKMPRHILNKPFKSAPFKISFFIIFLLLLHCSFAETEKGKNLKLLADNKLYSDFLYSLFNSLFLVLRRSPNPEENN